jgi:hypothetical protein
VVSSNPDGYIVKNRTVPWNETTVKNSAIQQKGGKESTGICIMRMVEMTQDMSFSPRLFLVVWNI